MMKRKKEGEEMYVLVSMINPKLKIQGQQPRQYILTQENIDNFFGGMVKIGEETNIYKRYIKGLEEVEIIGKKIIERIREEGEEGIRGYEEVVETSKGKVKIVYTYIKVEVIYVKGKGRYYIGYKVKSIRNVGIRMFDGIRGLDKENKRGTIEIVKHNKREMVRKGIKYLGNELRGEIYYVENTIYKEENFKDIEKVRVDLGLFIEEMMEE